MYIFILLLFFIQFNLILTIENINRKSSFENVQQQSKIDEYAGLFQKMALEFANEHAHTFDKEKTMVIFDFFVLRGEKNEIFFKKYFSNSMKKMMMMVFILVFIIN